MKEKRFKGWLIEAFKGAGNPPLCQSIEATSGSGIPDLAILNDGETLWVELKTVESGNIVELRPAQYAWHMLADREDVRVHTLCMRGGFAGNVPKPEIYVFRNDKLAEWMRQRNAMEPKFPLAKDPEGPARDVFDTWATGKFDIGEALLTNLILR